MNAFCVASCNLVNTLKSGIGISLSAHSPIIPCLFFTDDSILFFEASTSSCTKLKSIIDHFCQLSRQVINFHKSSIVVSKNALHAQKQIIASVFNIPHSNSLGKYLGCHVFQGKPKASLFSEILGKATTRMESWKANTLSKAGRTVLIQANLESLPSHTMQCFESLKKTTTLLDRVNRNFF